MWPFNHAERQPTFTEISNQELKNDAYRNFLNPQAQIIEDEKILSLKMQNAQITQWQQDRSLALKDIFAGFAGLKLIKQGNDYVYVTDEYNRAICSIWGAKKLVEFIRPQDHNAMLANWDDKKINGELFSIAAGLMDYIAENAESLGITLNNYEYIVDELVLAQHPTYQRGYNDGERKVIKETIKINQVDTTGQNKPVQQKVFGIPISEYR